MFLVEKVNKYLIAVWVAGGHRSPKATAKSSPLLHSEDKDHKTVRWGDRPFREKKKENFFRNLIESNRYRILFTIFPIDLELQTDSVRLLF